MAQKFAKWIGGAVGWAFAGPIGAAIGLGLGYLWDNATLEPNATSAKRGSQTREGDFNIALLVLSAAVMKADGRVLKSELKYIKDFLQQNYGSEKSLELLKVLKELLEQDIDVRGVSLQIKNYMSHAQRLQLMHFLLGIARADGIVDPSEINLLKQIATYLNISMQDYSSMDAMYRPQPTAKDYYAVLELEDGADEKEVKAAYRKLVKKYHPDRLGDVGDDVKDAAAEKFRKVQEAYEFLTEQKN